MRAVRVIPGCTVVIDAIATLAVEDCRINPLSLSRSGICSDRLCSNESGANGENIFRIRKSLFGVDPRFLGRDCDHFRDFLEPQWYRGKTQPLEHRERVILIFFFDIAQNPGISFIQCLRQSVGRILKLSFCKTIS